MTQIASKSTGLIATHGLELLTWTTPGGFRVSILLEELKEAYNLSYAVNTISLPNRVTKEPWYLALNPNGYIPTLVDHDHDAFVVTEGIAIMAYLARHYDSEHKFSFEDPLEASKAEQWLAWQAGNLGPTSISALLAYRNFPHRDAYSLQYYMGKTEQNYRVLDNHLANREYIAGPGRGVYSIADMSIFPFFDAMGHIGLELEAYPNAFKWWERIAKRPAVKKGMRVPDDRAFAFSHDALREAKEKDPVAWEERERPLREALENARKEFEGAGKR